MVTALRPKHAPDAQPDGALAQPRADGALTKLATPANAEGPLANAVARDGIDAAPTARFTDFTNGKRATALPAATPAQLDALYGADAKVSSAHLSEAAVATGRAVKDVVAGQGDAVDISRTAHETAAREIARLAPHVSPQERADASMAVASFALIGSDHIKDLARVDSGKTSTVGYMRDLATRHGRDVYADAQDASSGMGTLEPRFNDGTKGQSFHVGFFITAGYVANGSAVGRAMVDAAAIYHETADPDAFKGGGASKQDYVASMYGAMAGDRLKQMRDRGDGDLAASVVGGFLQKTGADEPRPAGRSEARHAIARADIKALHDQRNSVVSKTLIDHNPTVNLGIATARAINWLRRVQD